MSLNISLIKYKVSSSNKLYEEGLQIIDSSYITQTLYATIKNEGFLTEMEVFEEEGKVEKSIIETISESKIIETKTLIENEFIRLIDNKETQELITLHMIDPKKISIKMQEFRTLTNINHLLLLKSENFSTASNVIIKIG